MKNKKAKKSQFDINSQEIIKVLSIDEVRKMLPKVQYKYVKILRNGTESKKGEYVIIDGIRVSFRRIVSHFKLPMVCAATGKKADHYILYRKKDGSVHLDLFTEDKELLTIDHVKPIAKGGKDRIENMSLMTFEKNVEKSDKYVEA